MSKNRSTLFENNFRMAKKGFVEDADWIIENILKSLKNKSALNDSQVDYLIESFENILKGEDIGKAMYLKQRQKGAPKKRTGMRDLKVAQYMYENENSGLSFSDRLVEAGDRLFQDTGERIDKKAIEKAFTAVRKNQLKFEEDL